MTNKFKNVPVEQDTKIIFEPQAKLGEYDVLYQKWHLDGVTAESIIFADEDIVGVSDEEIQAEVKDAPLLRADSAITLKRSAPGFTFVNVNLES
jgi:hypothetical protein